jgi:xanthine dehydrogenase YagR molybdenum-binding subunit
MTVAPTRSLGTPVARLEGRDKVTGTARYAADRNPPGALHAWPVPAAVAKGEITAVDRAEALAMPGAVAVLAHDNAPRLALPEDGDRTLAVLQSPRIAHRGEIAALAVAETPQAARAMAQAVRIGYRERPHDVVLTADHPGLYVPDVAGGGEGEYGRGDPEGAYASSAVRVDVTYRTPAFLNHPMEPHATVATWEDDGGLTLHDSSQGAHAVRSTLAELFGIGQERVTVVSEHVGGGFGSKGTTRPVAVAAALAARHTRRTVRLALPRRQMADLVGHRAPTIQRIRLGADQYGHLTAVEHDTVTVTSTVREFVEAASEAARTMYANPHSRISHRVAALDVPSPSWMRAPGRASGMYALESAMDELAAALGMDSVELRLRNEPADGRDPDSGLPFSDRRLADCLRDGARRFGWHDRDPRPGVCLEGRLRIGTGVAAAGYPAAAMPSSAEVRTDGHGGYVVRVDATDIGTGARTVLAQVAADALGAPLDRVRMEIGRSDLPPAVLAAGSMGTASWSWAVDKACRALRDDGGRRGGFATASTEEDLAARPEYARHSFGAQFAEVAVDMDSGETRVRRLLGVFACGRILNPRTARSQLAGGMLMGLGMALGEGAHIDAAFGDYPECDLIAYHVPVCADVPPDLQVHWFDDPDPQAGPLGAKGIGEIGIVGTAAAIGNAVNHATGLRPRSLPLTPDVLLGLPEG